MDYVALALAEGMFFGEYYTGTNELLYASADYINEQEDNSNNFMDCRCPMYQCMTETPPYYLKGIYSAKNFYEPPETLEFDSFAELCTAVCKFMIEETTDYGFCSISIQPNEKTNLSARCHISPEDPSVLIVNCWYDFIKGKDYAQSLLQERHGSEHTYDTCIFMPGLVGKNPVIKSVELLLDPSERDNKDPYFGDFVNLTIDTVLNSALDTILKNRHLWYVTKYNKLNRKGTPHKPED